MASARTRDCSVWRWPPPSALPSGRSLETTLTSTPALVVLLGVMALAAGVIEASLWGQRRECVSATWGRSSAVVSVSPVAPGRPALGRGLRRVCGSTRSRASRIGAVDGVDQRSSLFHALRTLAERCREAIDAPNAAHLRATAITRLDTGPGRDRCRSRGSQRPRGQWRCTSASLVALQFGELTSYVQSTGATVSSAVSSALRDSGQNVIRYSSARDGLDRLRKYEVQFTSSAHDQLDLLRRAGLSSTRSPRHSTAPNRFTLR